MNIRRLIINLEKYRRRQDQIAKRLLEMAGRNPFDQILTRQARSIFPRRKNPPKQFSG